MFTDFCFPIQHCAAPRDHHFQSFSNCFEFLYLVLSLQRPNYPSGLYLEEIVISLPFLWSQVPGNGMTMWLCKSTASMPSVQWVNSKHWGLWLSFQDILPGNAGRYLYSLSIYSLDSCPEIRRLGLLNILCEMQSIVLEIFC